MKTLQFRIHLVGAKRPTVWRRVLMPADFTFDELHDAIQISFGWETIHLYQFSLKGWGSMPVYRIPHEMDGDTLVEDSRVTQLSTVFTHPEQTFTYIYDWSDDWTHHILLEKIIDKEITYPRCIRGAGTCPPENCGGIPGYENLMQALNDPKNPDHKEARKWVGLKRGENWDLNAYYQSDINDELADMEPIQWAPNLYPDDLNRV